LKIAYLVTPSGPVNIRFVLDAYKVAAGEVLLPEADRLPTVEELLNADQAAVLAGAAERVWRDGKINEVLWLRERHRDEQELGEPLTLSDLQFSELLTYIQDLRRWPESSSFPSSAGRPTPPTWVADQVH
jgi:hypothetical protein